MSSRDLAAEPSENPRPAAPNAESAPSRPIVTVSSLYGAGGTIVAPRVAERLGVEFHDRGIVAGIAERMRAPEEAVAAYEQPQSGIGRYIGDLARASGPDAAPMGDLDADEHRYRAESEEVLARATRTGGVVLGRGGVMALRSVPGVLHVLLGGPRDARIHQIMSREGIDQKTAERRADAHDRARTGWVSRSYGIDPLDPDLFHLRIDSTVIDFETCVDLIVSASRSMAQQ